jgi:tyrosine phenol-lyase
MAGGQPVSMQNIKEVSELAHKNGIKVVLDATRAMENAWFIQQREEGYANKSVAEILKEFASYSDAATMSGKKDLLVNIGGFVAVNDRDLFEELRNMVVVYEGLHTYGGLAGRDLEAMARGMEEAVQDDHMAARIRQVAYLGNLLDEYDIPMVKPFGGHAIFLDARKFYEHIPQTQYPAQALAANLYINSGVRGMERGIVSAGRDVETGKEHAPKLELVRLTIPRRVYTQAHLDVVAYSVAEVYENRKNAKGLKMTYEPRYLRFFQALFEEM